MFKPLEYVYFLIAVIEIASEISLKEELHFYSKSLLMIVLGVFYIQSITGKWNKVHQFIITAICFSWVGDVALTFVPNSAKHETLMGVTKAPHYFLVGIAGFLITHVLYILAFTFVDDRKSRPVLSQKVWVIIPLLVYFLGLLSILVPAIYKNEVNQHFMAPVLLYATTIGMMVVFSINRYKRVNEKSFVMVFAGAILFMLSDSIFAVNQFVYPFATSGILLMPLYIAGQYLIAKGCLAQFGNRG